MLIENIKKDQLQARKDKLAEKIKLLTTLIGEAEKIGKDNGGRLPTDIEVIETVQKFLKSNEITLSSLNEGTKALNDILKENEWLNKYMPKALTEFEIKELVEQVLQAQENPSIGSVMTYFKSNYAGQYDGKTLSKYAREKLV